MAYKLLLADDSVTIQRVIELTFADEDIQVIAVGDGQQAIEQIRAEHPDIVLADVGMPERDGFEVASFVKQTPEFRHIPVLLLTGAFEPVDQDRVRAAGCDGVLAKPFEPQLLIARVKELLTTPASERIAVPGPDSGLDDQPLHIPSSTPPPDSLEGLSLSANEAADSRASVDEYFDRLDAAFATMTGPAGTPSVPGSPAVSDSWTPGPVGAPPAEAARPARAVQSTTDAVRPDASVSQAAPAPAMPVVTGVSPEIAAAFDWLLAAEQGRPLPPDALPAPPGRPSAALDTVVDEITRRVVERLADRGVRDQVAEIVSKVAERLVRNEIERLKAGLK